MELVELAISPPNDGVIGGSSLVVQATGAADPVTQENKITKATKDQDEKYKSQEAKSLDKTVSEYSSDRESTNTELSAVLEYYAKIKERCIAKPESYEDRKARREAEIQGLKEALRTLQEETALMQRRKRGGGRRHSFLAAA